MNKSEFLNELRIGLSGLPQADIQEKTEFYSEMIDDKTEDGKTEQEAISEIGTVEDIVSQLASTTPLKTLLTKRIKPKRRLSALEITLIAVGFPVWFSLAVAAAAVVLSLYISIWAVVLSLWAVCLSFFAGFIGGVSGAVIFAVQENLPGGAVLFSAALILSGLGIFMFLGCKALSRYFIIGTKKAVIKLKASLIRKGLS